MTSNAEHRPHAQRGIPMTVITTPKSVSLVIRFNFVASILVVTVIWGRGYSSRYFKASFKISWVQLCATCIQSIGALQLRYDGTWFRSGPMDHQ